MNYNTSNKQDIELLKSFIEDNEWSENIENVDFSLKQDIANLKLKFVYSYDKYSYGVDVIFNHRLNTNNVDKIIKPFFNGFNIYNDKANIDMDFIHSNNDFKVFDFQDIIIKSHHCLQYEVTNALNPSLFDMISKYVNEPINDPKPK